MALGQEDYEWAAMQLGCEVAAIRAVAEVESGGDGFLPTGEPKILFEAHHFSRLTNNKYDKTHPNISSPTWNRKLYKGGIKEHVRLQAASALDRTAALKSASWGKFQIMGFNWNMTGYPSLQAFIDGMYEGEFGQLKAFVGFLKYRGLDKAIRELNWRSFAKGYNGASFAVNKYDTKLAKAYERAVA